MNSSVNSNSGRSNNRISLPPIHSPPSSRLPVLPDSSITANNTSYTATPPLNGLASTAASIHGGMPHSVNSPPWGAILRAEQDDDETEADVERSVLLVTERMSPGSSSVRGIPFYNNSNNNNNMVGGGHIQPLPSQHHLRHSSTDRSRSLPSSPNAILSREERRVGRSVPEFDSSSLSLPPITESVHAAPLGADEDLSGSPGSASDTSMSSSSTRFRRRKNLPFPSTTIVRSSTNNNISTGESATNLEGMLPVVLSVASNPSSPYSRFVNVPASSTFHPKIAVRGAQVDALESGHPIHQPQPPHYPTRTPLVLMRTHSLTAPRCGDLQLEDTSCGDDDDDFIAVDADEDDGASRSPPPPPPLHK